MMLFLTSENTSGLFEKPWQSWLFLGILALLAFIWWWYWYFFKKYTITYHSDNHIIDIKKVKARTEYKDLPLDAPHDEKNREFLGWYLTARLDERFSDAIMPRMHLHLYARWAEKKNDEQETKDA
ncbi:MAG: hypothetical protein WCX47_03540 [Bacilli bacterium]|nr:hypothetical protein [Bacilli bacterium]MDD3389424.1 hypothetical protein [Bacilli bacterium]MDD4344823.1 hypothetical protein [Bacilli bacterium]MDD4520791.1 hypothetical protein [Bacilli bacterium]MDY0399435.1 hypothetical protein [Bacilli bacterium]